MKTRLDERLDNLVEFLSAQIPLLRASGLNESARLLEMAKLEIQMHIHSISDQELRELCALADERVRAGVAIGRPSGGEQLDGSGAVRASSARVVVPLKQSVSNAKSPRKHAR